MDICRSGSPSHGLMRWHCRKRPDTVTRIRHLPVSRVQSDHNVLEDTRYSMDKGRWPFIDFVHWLRSAPSTSTRPAHIPSVSADSSSRHFDLSPVQASGSAEAERILVVRLACIFGHLIVKNYQQLFPQARAGSYAGPWISANFPC